MYGLNIMLLKKLVWIWYEPPWRGYDFLFKVYTCKQAHKYIIDVHMNMDLVIYTLSTHVDVHIEMHEAPTTILWFSWLAVALFYSMQQMKGFDWKNFVKR